MPIRLAGRRSCLARIRPAGRGLPDGVEDARRPAAVGARDRDWTPKHSARRSSVSTASIGPAATTHLSAAAATCVDEAGDLLDVVGDRDGGSGTGARRRAGSSPAGAPHGPVGPARSRARRRGGAAGRASGRARAGCARRSPRESRRSAGPRARGPRSAPAGSPARARSSADTRRPRMAAEEAGSRENGLQGAHALGEPGAAWPR